MSRSTVNRSNFWISCYRCLLKNMMFMIRKVNSQRGSGSQTPSSPTVEGSGARTAQGGCSPRAGTAAAPSALGHGSGVETLVRREPCMAPHALPRSLLPRARAQTPSHLSIGSSRALPCSALLGQLKRSGFLAAVYYSPERAFAHRRQSLAEANKEGKQKDSASLEGFSRYQ